MSKERIARRVARDLNDGDVVNLGIGLPTMVADYVPEGIEITLQSENGILGMGPLASSATADKHLINSGGQNVTVLPGAAYFDSAFSFMIIRGGHVDMTVLGALQVDAHGNLASHIVPGKMVPGYGRCYGSCYRFKESCCRYDTYRKRRCSKDFKGHHTPRYRYSCS